MLFFIPPQAGKFGALNNGRGYLEPIQIIFLEGLITAVVSETNLEFIFKSILFFTLPQAENF
jgi:hypothetical protein